jgi:hypothetical protein
MSARLALCTLMAVALPAAGKTCEELVVEIAAKIDASGVKGYSLEIVPAALVSGDKVVGTCDLGAKKITYVREALPRKPPARPASGPPAKP